MFKPQLYRVPVEIPSNPEIKYLHFIWPLETTPLYDFTEFEIMFNLYCVFNNMNDFDSYEGYKYIKYVDYFIYDHVYDYALKYDKIDVIDYLHNLGFLNVHIVPKGVTCIINGKRVPLMVMDPSSWHDVDLVPWNYAYTCTYISRKPYSIIDRPSTMDHHYKSCVYSNANCIIGLLNYYTYGALPPPHRRVDAVGLFMHFNDSALWLSPELSLQSTAHWLFSGEGYAGSLLVGENNVECLTDSKMNLEIPRPTIWLSSINLNNHNIYMDSDKERPGVHIYGDVVLPITNGINNNRIYKHDWYNDKDEMVFEYVYNSFGGIYNSKGHLCRSDGTEVNDLNQSIYKPKIIETTDDFGMVLDSDLTIEDGNIYYESGILYDSNF